MAQRYQPAGLLPTPPPSPAAESRDGNTRRGRQSRGGNRRPAQRSEPNVRPPRVNGGPPLAGPPRPTHLATVSTPERNDPLWTTGLAGAELQPMPNVEYIHSGAEFLPQVVSVIHSSSVTASAGYSRRVPESALGYYCGVLTYARMLQLQAGNGLLVTPDEERFVEQVSSLSLSPPMLMAHYLSGFGNTRVPSGRDLRFQMLPRDYTAGGNTRGWFGRVSQDTQPLYQSYPCLGVYSAKLLADAAPGDFQPHWGFPAEVTPLAEGGHATTACLGYAHRTQLSNAQRAFLVSAGIVHGQQFPTVNNTFPLNVALLLSVQGELNAVPTLKMSPMPTAMVGSQAQLGMIVFEEELDPVLQSTPNLTSPFQLAPEISFSASAFGYRVLHSIADVEDDTVAPWVVWFWPSRPENYFDFVNVGNLLRDDEPMLIQELEFRTTPYLLRARLEALERALREHG